MKPVAAVVAILVLVLTASPLAGPLTGTADAAPGPSAPAQVPEPGGPLKLQIAQVEPRIVTSDGPNTLTVSGTLTNTGTAPVGRLQIRVQRGLALGTEGALRDALDGSAGTDAVTPQFTPLPDLPPGGQVPVRLSLLLRGPPETSLALTEPGVYELMVNVNGVPAEGARARLAAVRMLLPVLSLPPDPTAPVSRSSTAPTAPAASPFTLLYPIADRPRRLSTVGAETTLLTDDDLAASLAPTGRLGGLVAALAAAPVGSAVRSATCLAIDPDLVETAAAMRTGYQVVGADGTLVAGTGAAAAAQWLDGLVAAARGGCVIPLSYADADLVALSRGGLGDLATLAVSGARPVLDALLNTPSVPGVTWPADGVVDGATMDRIAAAGSDAVLLSASGVEQARTQRRAGVLPIYGGEQPQFALLTDPLLSLAATGPLQLPAVGSGGAVPATTPAGSASPLSTQDAIGALAFRARSGPDGSEAPVVLAPPHQWAAEGTGATALLDAVDTLIQAGLVTPDPLEPLLAEGPPPAAEAQPVTYPLRASGREIPGAVVDAVRTTDVELADLRSTGVENSGIGLSPTDVLAPVQLGLVRPTSAAFRGLPEAAARAAAAGARRVADLRAAVRVVEPPSPYALGASNAPILVTIGNGLPFTVRVQLEISSTSGLRVAPIEMQIVPPLGRRQATVSAEVTRAGQFTVRALVRSPGGEVLGPPSRLRVRSTAYGTITVWLTASAGLLLVVLAGRRVLRRIRGETDRRPPVNSDPNPPEPNPPQPSPPTEIPVDQGRPEPIDPGPPDHRADPSRPITTPAGHPSSIPHTADDPPVAPSPVDLSPVAPSSAAPSPSPAAPAPMRPSPVSVSRRSDPSPAPSRPGEIPRSGSRSGDPRSGNLPPEAARPADDRPTEAIPPVRPHPVRPYLNRPVVAPGRPGPRPARPGRTEETSPLGDTDRLPRPAPAEPGSPQAGDPRRPRRVPDPGPDSSVPPPTTR